jgi:hypothetical protein
VPSNFWSRMETPTSSAKSRCKAKVLFQVSRPLTIKKIASTVESKLEIRRTSFLIFCAINTNLTLKGKLPSSIGRSSTLLLEAMLAQVPARLVHPPTVGAIQVATPLHRALPRHTPLTKTQNQLPF